MDRMVWGSVVLLYGMVLLLLLVYWFQQRKLRKKDEQIHALQVSLSNFQNKLRGLERRRAFRIALMDHECTFELIEFEDKTLESLKHKKGKGLIKDISWTGMELSCDYDFPVRKGIYLKLDFVLHHEEFSLKGKIVRKVELMNEINYGIEFVDVSAQDQQRLFVVIQKIDIERKKKTKVE